MIIACKSLNIGLNNMHLKGADTFLVTVLTPTWNRTEFLERVWNRLNNQTYKNIEWIVCNDGSTDSTSEILKELSKRSKFSVTVITANIHIGKAYMDNIGVEKARGEFILWNDSDDYLLPDAVENLVSTWNSIPESERKNYVGVTALCSNGTDVISSELPENSCFDTTWNDLRLKYGITGDMLHFTKADLLKINKFPEIDFVIPEGIVWTTLGNLKTRVIPQVVQIKQYNAPNCISFSKKMEYSRAKAYSLVVTYKNTENYDIEVKEKIWKLITFIRYSVHGEFSILEALNLWKNNIIRIVVLFLYPLGYLLACKDNLNGVVVKTHRQFDQAKKTVKLDVYTN